MSETAKKSNTFTIAASAGAISEVLARADASKDRDALRQEILMHLLDAGFERARFYERCADNAREGIPFYVLVAEASADKGPEHSNVGEYIDETDNNLGYQISKHSVYVGDPTVFDEPPDWFMKFDMEGRRWVDVTLRASEDIVGLIALDWKPRRKIPDSELSVLGAIGLMIGSHLQLRPHWRVAEFRSKLSPPSPAQAIDPPDVLIRESAKILGSMLDARMVAVLEYVWTTGELHKRFEIDTRDGIATDGKETKFRTGVETYSVGQRLTGTAWQNELKRHIPIFANLSDDLADEESKKRHAAYMDEEVNSCLYGFLGGSEPRYMLRFINRSQGGFMPFVGEVTFLAELLTELRSDLETSTAVARTRNLESATRKAAGSGRPDELVEQIAPLLQEEGVETFAFLCHQGSPQYAYQGVMGVGKPVAIQDTGEWKQDALYAKLVSESAARTLKLGSKAGSAVAGLLNPNGHDRVVGFSFKVGETTGALIVPTKPASEINEQNLVAKCGASRLSLFHAYARLMGDVVDSFTAHERAEGARQALGVLGHELASPLAQLETAAENGFKRVRHEAIDAQIRHERNDSDGALEAADNIQAASSAYLGKISESRRTVGAAMDLGPIVAKETNGRLEMQFWKFNLGQLIFKTIDAIEQEIELSFDGPPGRRYEFDAKPSVLRLEDMAGDEALLQHALLNLLRNAAKYSMTPGGGSNLCPVTITAERQSDLDIIVVHDWGRAVLPEEMEAIFHPWTRFDEDAIVARRGMGLGLFLSRRIALAHGGDVRCRRSDPTLNLADRQARREGFDTEFELRLPTDHEEGAYIHTWRAGEPVRRPQKKPTHIGRKPPGTTTGS